jgi:hypothetical protein
MKKWYVLAGVVVVVCLTVVVVVTVSQNQTPAERQLEGLRKDVKILRVVAEHRELLWKVQEYEKKLPQFQNRYAAPAAKPVIRPVPADANVTIR